jgi:hypothetical protein
MGWAEVKYPDPSKKANPTAAVTTTGSAVVTQDVKAEAAPAALLKKPASGLNPEKVGQEISDLIRKEFLPGYKLPAGSKSSG